MISPRSWVWPLFSPITGSVFLPLRCQKKAEEADREGQRTLDQRVYLEGCGVLFSSTGMKRAVPCCLSCVFGSGCPPPRCVYSAVLGIVCVPTCPCCCFPGMLGCVSRASSHLLAYSLTWPFDLRYCCRLWYWGGPEGYHGDL